MLQFLKWDFADFGLDCNMIRVCKDLGPFFCRRVLHALTVRTFDT